MKESRIVNTISRLIKNENPFSVFLFEIKNYLPQF